MVTENRISGRAKEDVPPPDLHFRGLNRERRVTPRWGGNPVMVDVSDAAGQGVSYRAVVIDRSDTGIGLSLDRKVEPGCVLSVRVAADEGSWVRVEVKNCVAVGPYWEAGCQFMDAPAGDVARLFG